jgi:hypothetical protein
MIDNVVINARALSIITAMADVPRDRLMAATPFQSPWLPE